VSSHFFPETSHKQLLIDLPNNLKAIVYQRLIPGSDGKYWPAVKVPLTHDDTHETFNIDTLAMKE